MLHRRAVQTEHTQASVVSEASSARLETSASLAPSEGQRSSAVLTKERTAADQRARIDHEELVSDLLRLRWVSQIGLVAWSIFAVQDWIIVRFTGHGTLSVFWAIRVAGMLPIGLVMLRLRSSRPLSRSMLNVLDVGVFSAVQAGITLICLASGGIMSGHVTGVMVALITRGSVLAAPWRRGAWLIGLPLLTYPLLMAGSTLVVPAMRAQFSDPVTVSMFVQHLFVLAVSASISIWGGHGAWAIRRQLFQARSIGKYRLKHCTGRGGMGEVWVAYHPGLQRDVALKILRPDQDADPVAVRRFEHEVSATTRLTHPNTVRVFDYGVTEDGIWYYAMELLEGKTLAELVTTEKRLGVHRALHIAHQVARALAEAHARGIYHRDVKPENVFITCAGDEPDFAKVLDFGIAKLSQEATVASLTRTGSIFGTPAYMSPEGARGRETDARSDVYSLGAVLYFMLTGESPFQAASSTELLLCHINQPAPSLSTHPELKIPTELDELVLRCLAKDPAARFADARELADAIGECRKGLSASA